MRSEKPTIGLSITVQNLKTFKELDKSLFERYYLGYPYCLEKAGSFMLEVENLKQALSEIKTLGKEAYLVTPPIMQSSDFNKVGKVIAEVVDYGLDGIEVNDVGMFAAARKWSSLRITAGHFTNIYHPEAALEYVKEGATTVIPNSELMFEELREVAERVGSDCLKGSHPEEAVGRREDLSKKSKINVEIAVHGNLPLGFAYDCFLKKIDPEGKCRQQCTKPYILANDEVSMASVGRANIMAADFCLIEQIDDVKSVGTSLWRLDIYKDNADKINKVAKIFKRCIEGEDSSNFMSQLENLAPHGLCNGWFFGKSGHEYVTKEKVLS